MLSHNKYSLKTISISPVVNFTAGLFLFLLIHKKYIFKLLNANA